jgi:Protein of unknown function (DUF2490)
MKKNLSILLLLTSTALTAPAQTRTKEINHQYQSWMSINSNIHFHNKWSLLADVHIRRNHFLADAGFYFIRSGLQYDVNKNFSVAAGYAHLWAAPTTPGWKTYINENRIYQQWQYSSSIKKIHLLQRIRNEQRWQQKIVNDTYTGKNRFTNRIRYLLSITIPVFKNEKLPALVLADELHLHFGKEVVYNTFDQNRYFIGIKQKISRQLSFDMGYMKLYQKKYSGYHYDSNDTFRLFFYYNASVYKKQKT